MSDDIGPVPLGARPAVAHGYRLQWEAVQDAHVLLYPEGMVKLNGSAAAILTRCDGVRTIEEIVTDIERTYDATGLSNDIAAFVAIAVRRGWLEVRE